MSVPYTSYQRSDPMSEAEAKAIAAQTHLFGYQPDAYPLRGSWHLSICSDADAQIVRDKLVEIRAARH